MENLNSPQKGALLYLSATGTFFLVIFIIFIFFPRPTFSELEKRDLQTFPKIEDHKDNLPGYTAGISEWFSNTQPYRDKFLTASMSLRSAMKYKPGSDEDAVSFIATSDSRDNNAESSETGEDVLDNDFPENLAEENAKIANAGIIVAGNAPNARAMMVFGGSEKSGTHFINTINKYAEEFPGKNIYAVIAPSAADFYMPEKVKSRNHSQLPTLNHIKENLKGVKYVDVHTPLRRHADEDIFLRTDHHWSPLGAFYAAQALAKTAGVPFADLDSYNKHVLHRFVGTMYGYSKDISVKNSAEDFVYYTPKDTSYTATYTTYYADKDFHVTSISKPYKSSFFKKYKDGSGLAYSTFMGGDPHTVHVKTSANTPRKLLIIKDSYGNAIPGYLFSSFSDIHVVDFRYFNKNIKKYVADNGITDIAFIFNIFNASSSDPFRKVDRFLTQADGYIEPKKQSATETKERKDSVSSPKTVEKELPAPETPEENKEKPEPPVETPVQVSDQPAEE